MSAMGGEKEPEFGTGVATLVGPWGGELKTKAAVRKSPRWGFKPHVLGTTVEN